jgi:3-dehydroquinate dehydratase
MGELGKQSRIDCIAKGSLFTYASLDKNKQSAPGQLTVKEMRKALRLD